MQRLVRESASIGWTMRSAAECDPSFAQRTQRSLAWSMPRDSADISVTLAAWLRRDVSRVDGLLR